MSRTPNAGGGARWIALGGVGAALTLATVAMLIPTAATAAKWQTRVFSASYDGNGSFNYSAKGSTTDTGCYMTMGVDSKYGFAQLWTIKAEFRRRAGGGWDSKVDSIKHVDGPQATATSDSATLQGKQVKYQGDCYDARVKGPDTGVLDCSSGAPQLTAWTDPQMEITRDQDYLDIVGRAFLDAHLSYSGKDTIPTDVKYFHGCAHYDDEWTFGSTLIPGTYDTAKVAFGVHQLATLAKGTPLKRPVSPGQNTLYKPQQVCDSTFGRPNNCIINSQVAEGGVPAQRGEVMGNEMAASDPKSVRFDVKAETTASPEQVIEIAGKDFSPSRAGIWPNVTKARLTVHERGATHADVTEGGTGPARFIWERSRYEWSQPGVVRATVIDSNALLAGTTFELRATPRVGGSTVEMVLNRQFLPTGWGRVGYALNRVFGPRGFAFMLRQMLRAVEKPLADGAPPSG